MSKVKVGSRELPIVCYVETKQMGPVPLVDAPMMSDFTWHLRALQSRMNDPEFYRDVLGEDVGAEIVKLQNMLAEYDGTMNLEEAI